MIDLKRANDAFDNYVKNYDMSNEKINLKYYHTYRVCEQSIAISKSLNLSKEDTDIAYLIALLHDIGRFEQIKRFNTFDDEKSIDHALFGCKILFEEGLIRDFIIDDSYDKIIRKAIFNHNKFTIQEGLDERELLHSKIIRDIDKIDIIYNATDLGQIKLNDDDSEISEKVKESFYKGNNVSKLDMKTHNDTIMVKFAFVFDLNFKYSFEYFKENDFVNKMYSKLKNKSIFKDYVDELNKYIEGKCNDVRN